MFRGGRQSRAELGGKIGPAEIDDGVNAEVNEFANTIGGA